MRFLSQITFRLTRFFGAGVHYPDLSLKGKTVRCYQLYWNLEYIFRTTISGRFIFLIWCLTSSSAYDMFGSETRSQFFNFLVLKNSIYHRQKHNALLKKKLYWSYYKMKRYLLQKRSNGKHTNIYITSPCVAIFKPIQTTTDILTAEIRIWNKHVG